NPRRLRFLLKLPANSIQRQLDIKRLVLMQSFFSRQRIRHVTNNYCVYIVFNTPLNDSVYNFIYKIMNSIVAFNSCPLIRSYMFNLTVVIDTMFISYLYQLFIIQVVR